MNHVNNPATGPGDYDYGVDIPPTGQTGQITGYAFSENIGAIDFNPHAGCPGSPKYPGACDPYPADPSCSPGSCPTTDAMRNADNTVTGWARFTEIAQANAVGNSGGWTGWIKLAGPNYGVSVDPNTGNLSGYAWSDELGTIKFAGDGASWNGSSCTGANDHGNSNQCNYGAQIPLPPTVSLSANPLTINLNTGGSLPQNVALSWTVNGATSCTKSGGSWSGTIANPTTGTDSSVSQTVGTVDYKLTCTGLGGTTSADVTVTTGCYVKSCSGTSCALGTSLTPTGSTTTAACTALDACSTDTDCTPRTPTGWQEVAP